MAGGARISGDLHNLSRTTTQSNCRPDLVVTDRNYRFARANSGKPSRRQALT